MSTETIRLIRDGLLLLLSSRCPDITVMVDWALKTNFLSSFFAEVTKIDTVDGTLSL